MKFGKLKFLLIFLLVISGAALSLSYKVTAQSNSSILIDVIPPNPVPFEDITITLSSYASNLDGVLIKWFLNGKITSSGIGKKSFSLKAGAAGSVSTVITTISLPEGKVETKTIIKPSVMELLWQANDSSVPPFYKGKALPTAESEIKVVAMPEVRNSSGLVNPKNMTYSWKKDYSNDQDASGYGKNFFIYINDYLENTNNIGVTAGTIDGQSSTDANIDIGTVQPKILFYRNDNDVGIIWDKTLADSYRMQGDEIIVAIPYFISPKNIQNPRLVFTWLINDRAVPILGFRKNVMPLKVPEGTSGTSKLRLNIENRDKIFQTASKEINIEF